jgi:hypothetical protein
MKSEETGPALRALIAVGVAAMALLGLVACATTSTTPVSRQADPAFARKVVTYPTPVPPGTIVIDPGSHLSGARSCCTQSLQARAHCVLPSRGKAKT